MTNIEKAKILGNYFGMYGHGNFDLTYRDVAKILSILELPKVEMIVKLKKFYDGTYKARMGEIL